MKSFIKSRKEKIAKLLAEIAAYQCQCEHKNATTKYGSNDGNYDPSADCYWIEVFCNDCGKFMMFDSKDNPKEYRFWSLKAS